MSVDFTSSLGSRIYDPRGDMTLYLEGLKPTRRDHILPNEIVHEYKIIVNYMNINMI